MRISEHRYARDRSRYDLAYRLMGLGARPQTIANWTGLSEYQIKSLGNSYRQSVQRRRGRSPFQLNYFWRNAERRQQAAIFAGICRAMDVFPSTTLRVMKEFTTLSRGLRLCRAYQSYVVCVGEPLMTFEHAALLAWEVCRGEAVGLDKCRDCHAVILVDRYAVRLRECAYCNGQLSVEKYRVVKQEAGGLVSVDVIPPSEMITHVVMALKPRKCLRHQRRLF